MPMPSAAEAAIEAEAEHATTQEGIQAELDMLRQKILFSLEIFPFINKSQLHMALGTSTSRRLWQPILDRLIREGEICIITVNARTPLNRHQQFTLYHLPHNIYTPTHPDISIASPAGANASTAADSFDD